MGALEEAAQATAITLLSWRDRGGIEASRRCTDRLHQGLKGRPCGTPSALFFAFQLSRERIRVVDLSKRLDNGGGINRDGARLRVRVSAIGHE